MYAPVKTAVDARFAELTKLGNLLAIDADPDAIWAAYLESFPPESRQEHTCSACKAFIRQAGTAVRVDPDTLELQTVWDVDVSGEPEYEPSIRALRDYVRSRPIAGLWSHPNATVGVDRNPDPKRPGTVWTHYHGKVPRGLQRTDATAARSGELRDTAALVKRSMEELRRDAVATVLELVAQNSLYRANEYRAQLDFLKGSMARWDATAPELHDRLSWALAQTTSTAVARARNTAVGTLLVDLSEGRDLEAAVSAYERIMAPQNYRRPTSLVTPRMVESAKERMSELGLLASLDRRRLDTRDVPADKALFVHRPKPQANDVFAEMKGEAQVADPKTLSKVEEVPVATFVERVLPGAKGIRVLFERDHLGNLATLTGPRDPSAPSLFKWDNGLGWSYTGGLADSIKQRVKDAGGNVEGWMRISLSWNNHDDLDLHLVAPGGDRDVVRGHVYYGNKVVAGIGALDVDMNAGGPMSRTPVENIHVPKKLKAGRYRVFVHNFNARDNRDKGFDLEIEVNGEVMRYGSPTSPRSQAAAPDVWFTVAADGSVSFDQQGLTSAASGVTKWGLKTGTWHTAKVVTESPNRWSGAAGPKHLFFLLEGCTSDERTRPFLNEFLRDDLAQDRKVTEVLGSKLEVAPAEGAELSGLGFSETVRSHVYVEVEGQFKRTVKVVF